MDSENKKVYSMAEIQYFLGLGRTKTYKFLEEVYKNQKPFRVLKIGKLYRIHKESFDNWLNSNWKEYQLCQKEK